MTGPVCYIDLLGFSYLTDHSDDINIKAIIKRYVSVNLSGDKDLDRVKNNKKFTI